MNEIHEDGAPFFFATRELPSATAIDDDIYLTVTTTVPAFPGRMESDRHHPLARLRAPCDRAAFRRSRHSDEKRGALSLAFTHPLAQSSA